MKLYSSATGFFMPLIMPARVVIPDRDVPGSKAKIWASPIIAACLIDILVVDDIN